MNDILDSIKKMSLLLLFTAILVSGVSVLCMFQQFEINNLKHEFSLRETSWQAQLKFDQSVTTKFLGEQSR